MLLVLFFKWVRFYFGVDGADFDFGGMVIMRRLGSMSMIIVEAGINGITCPAASLVSTVQKFDVRLLAYTPNAL